MNPKYYEVILHRKAERSLEKLPRSLQKRILEFLNEMSYDPFTGDVKPLKGLPGLFRRRAGYIRIVYLTDFEHRKVVVLRIAYRGRAYKSSR